MTQNNDCQYKVLAVERILQDNPCGVTVKQIIEKLDYEYGVKAERKAIYHNLYVLGWFFAIEKKRNGHEHIYYILED
jgi:hypothetical protein